MNRLGSWVVAIVLSAAALTGVGFVSVGVAYLWADQNDIDAEQARINDGLTDVVTDMAKIAEAQIERDCQQDIRNISNQRTMFITIFDKFPAEGVVAELRADLDRLIPPHECINGVALPMEVQP